MKYVLGIFGFIILTIVAVVLLVSVTSTRTSNNQTGKKVVTMADYTDNGTVTYTTQGKVVGEGEYKEIRFVINASERRVQLLSGYGERVVREQSFANNKAAFDTFMRALGNAGYSREKTSTITDSRGVCPLGLRYLYNLKDNGKDVVNTWATSCNSRDGTFGGDQSLIRVLFENQVPRFNDFVGSDDL